MDGGDPESSNSPVLSKNPDLAEVNIVVLGKDGTGKSAIIVRLLTRRFIHEYDPTAEDVYAYNAQVDGRRVRMKLMDTAGLVERTVHKREEQLHWGDGYLLVLSLTSRSSLREVVKMKEVIDEIDTSQGKPLVLLATKRDLVQAREVTAKELQELAKRWRCLFYETSATDEYSLVAEPFLTLCREILRLKGQKGFFPAHIKLEKEIVLSDINKRYRNRLFTK